MRIEEFLVEGTFDSTFVSLQGGRGRANLCTPRKTGGGTCASVMGVSLERPLARWPTSLRLLREPLSWDSVVWRQEFEVLLHFLQSRGKRTHLDGRDLAYQLPAHCSTVPPFCSATPGGFESTCTFLPTLPPGFWESRRQTESQILVTVWGSKNNYGGAGGMAQLSGAAALYRGFGGQSQHPCSASQPSVTPDPGDPVLPPSMLHFDTRISQLSRCCQSGKCQAFSSHHLLPMCRKKQSKAETWEPHRHHIHVLHRHMCRKKIHT